MRVFENIQCQRMSKISGFVIGVIFTVCLFHATESSHCGLGQCTNNTVCCPGERQCCIDKDHCCGQHCCRQGYKCCNGSARCCKSASSCCGDSLCCPDDSICCPTKKHCCPKDYNCCFDNDGCCPKTHHCCGRYCCAHDMQCCPNGTGCYSEGYSCCGGGLACPYGYECCGNQCCGDGFKCCGGVCCSGDMDCCGKSCCQGSAATTTYTPNSLLTHMGVSTRNTAGPQGTTFSSVTSAPQADIGGTDTQSSSTWKIYLIIPITLLVICAIFITGYCLIRKDKDDTKSLVSIRNYYGKMKELLFRTT